MKFNDRSTGRNGQLVDHKDTSEADPSPVSSSHASPIASLLVPAPLSRAFFDRSLMLGAGADSAGLQNLPSHFHPRSCSRSLMRLAHRRVRSSSGLLYAVRYRTSSSSSASSSSSSSHSGTSPPPCPGPAPHRRRRLTPGVQKVEHHPIHLEEDQRGRGSIGHPSVTRESQTHHIPSGQLSGNVVRAWSSLITPRNTGFESGQQPVGHRPASQQGKWSGRGHGKVRRIFRRSGPGQVRRKMVRNWSL